MPITQDRFLTVIRGAKAIIATNKAFREIVMNNWSEDISFANSVLQHTTDNNAKQVINTLINRITLAQHAFLLEPLDAELIGIIIAEDLHFQKHEKQNTRSAKYRKFIRQQQGIVPRSRPELAPTPPVNRSSPITEPVKDFENTQEFRDFQTAMHAKWDNTSERSERRSDLQQTVAERSELRPDLLPNNETAEPQARIVVVNTQGCICGASSIEQCPGDRIYPTCHWGEHPIMPPQNIPSERSELSHFLGESIDKQKSESSQTVMPTTPEPVAEVRPQLHKDGVIRYLPDNNTAPPIPSDKDLL